MTIYAKINGYIAGGQTNSVGCSSGAGTTANDSFATKLGFSRTANTAFTMYALAYVVVDGTTYYADSVATCTYTPQA